jgi:prevent-host-death family protein
MEVSISQFRREIFDLVNRAAEGEEISLTHRGRRFRVVPETPAGGRLDRLTPLQVVNPQADSLDDREWKQAMVQAWERDWADL